MEDFYFIFPTAIIYVREKFSTSKPFAGIHHSRENQIPITDLLAKTNTHPLSPTELGHHGCASFQERWNKLAEMDKPEG